MCPYIYRRSLQHRQTIPKSVSGYKRHTWKDRDNSQHSMKPITMPIALTRFPSQLPQSFRSGSLWSTLWAVGRTKDNLKTHVTVSFPLFKIFQTQKKNPERCCHGRWPKRPGPELVSLQMSVSLVPRTLFFLRLIRSMSASPKRLCLA